MEELFIKRKRKLRNKKVLQKRKEKGTNKKAVSRKKKRKKITPLRNK